MGIHVPDQQKGRYRVHFQKFIEPFLLNNVYYIWIRVVGLPVAVGH